MARGSPQLEPLNLMVDLEEDSDIIDLEEKDIHRVEGLEELQPPPSSVAVVAVSGSRKDKHTIKWALEKFAHEEFISFQMLHVRPVITRIPTPSLAVGNLIPISQVREDVADAFKRDVEWHVHEKLLPCKRLCTQRKVQVELVQIESNDVVSALAEHVSQHGIRRLVIGASSRSIFSRNRTLSSKISEGCPNFCTVYVVSKGKLSSLRPSDSGTNGSNIGSQTSVSADDTSSQSLSSQTFSIAHTSMESFSSLRPALHQLEQFQAISALNQALLHERVPSSGSLASTSLSLINEETDFTSVRPHFSDPNAGTCSDVSCNNSENSSSSGALTSATSISKQVNMNFELEKLRIQLRHMRGMYTTAQDEANDASEKLNELVKRREDEEENLKQIYFRGEKGKEIAQEMNEKCEAAKRDAELIIQCAEMQARERRDAETRASRESREKQIFESALNNTCHRFRHLTWQEIVSATSSFHEDLKIGMGAYGSVYKCHFQHTTAAVKIHTKETCRDKQFYQELEILSQNRHPNLLILLGACPDHGCLVYEFMENGSLDDRLMRKNNTPPLPWFVRFRIAWEVSSALLYLHHSKPRAIIHRDLKPGNILLDSNFVSKIGDVGLSMMVSEEDLSSSVAASDSAPVGTPCYIDPEYQRTGVISPKSDVYALGMVILQLLTAKPAIGLAYTVEVAVENDRLEEVLDPDAGSWPIQETKELAALALKCTELRQADRPDLQDEVLPLMEKMKDLVEKSQDSVHETAPQPPNHFLCPILKEIMIDPCVAADGYTYDRKAIEMWLENNNSSPITTQPLPHKGLLPNYALLSAIVEWSAGKRT